MSDKKLSHEEFVRKAFETLRKPEYKGLHTVYSGFNRAFKEYFNEDPIAATKQLELLGKLVIRPAKGGVMLYLPESGVLPNIGGNDALKKMGL